MPKVIKLATDRNRVSFWTERKVVLNTHRQGPHKWIGDKEALGNCGFVHCVENFVVTADRNEAAWVRVVELCSKQSFAS